MLFFFKVKRYNLIHPISAQRGVGPEKNRKLNYCYGANAFSRKLHASTKCHEHVNIYMHAMYTL